LLNKTSNIAVIILAAGASSRMGTPKQLLKWKNTTLLGHALKTTKGINQSKIVVVLGANFELIKAKVNLDNCEILKNENWEEGLGKSIATGVSHVLRNDLNIDAVLVMLADQPLIDGAYLNTMIIAYREGAFQIVATSYKNGKQGVPVLFDKAYFQELSQLNDDKGAKAILRKHAANVIVVNATHDVSDIDTIDAYERLYAANH